LLGAFSDDGQVDVFVEYFNMHVAIGQYGRIKQAAQIRAGEADDITGIAGNVERACPGPYSGRHTLVSTLSRILLS